MSRLLVFALVLSLGSTSTALAGETLLSSATRVAREAARNEAPSQPKSDAATRVEKSLAVRSVAATASAGESPSGSTLASAQGGLAASGMSKRKKLIIALAAAVGFAATAYTIDRKVQDNTPSSLGTREDK